MMYPMATQYDVLVSIVNYRTARRTLDCVQSIIDHTSSALRLYIVITDNNSGEEDSAILEAWQKEHVKIAHIVLHQENSGFAGGHAIGIGHALQAGIIAEYVWILNSDTLLMNDCASILCEYLRAHTEIGLASPQLYNDDGTPHQTAEYYPTLAYKIAGRGMMRLLALVRGSILPPLSDEYDVPISVQVVSGAAMFVRMTAYHATGGLDTRYFLYCEEEDIALAMRRHGYKVVVVPQAKIIHSGSASTEVRSITIRKEYYRSLLKLYAKWFPAWKVYVLRRFLVMKIVRKHRVDSSAHVLADFVATIDV